MIEIENSTDLKGKTTGGKVQPQKRNVLIGCTGSVATIKLGNIIEQLQSSKYQVSHTWMLTRLKPQGQGLKPLPNPKGRVWPLSHKDKDWPQDNSFWPQSYWWIETVGRICAFASCYLSHFLIWYFRYPWNSQHFLLQFMACLFQSFISAFVTYNNNCC